MGIFVLFALSIVYYLKDELLNCNTIEEILTYKANIENELNELEYEVFCSIKDEKNF